LALFDILIQHSETAAGYVGRYVYIVMLSKLFEKLIIQEKFIIFYPTQPHSY